MQRVKAIKKCVFYNEIGVGYMSAPFFFLF